VPTKNATDARALQLDTQREQRLPRTALQPPRSGIAPRIAVTSAAVSFLRWRFGCWHYGPRGLPLCGSW
jgi:hypothetical protein